MPEIVHGSATRGYNYGCRCEECRAANNARQKAFQRNRRLAGLSDAQRADAIRRVNELVATFERPFSDAEYAKLFALIDTFGRKPRGGNRRPRGVTHGKPSTYSVYGCRCEICTPAYKAWRAERERLRSQNA